MKGIKLEDLPEKYRAQALAQIGTASAPPNVEQGAGNEQVAKKEAPRFDGPVSIVYSETRGRLTDSDGACTKYVTDALVSGGVLCNDTTKEIPESPKRTQTKGPEEKTVIEIWSYVEPMNTTEWLMERRGEIQERRNALDDIKPKKDEQADPAVTKQKLILTRDINWLSDKISEQENHFGVHAGDDEA